MQNLTAGRGWIAEYGDVTVAQDFRRLLGYSPLHNISRSTTYPPTLVVTGDHDDRVVQGHSYTFVAQLQQAQGAASATYLQVLANIGHGAGTQFETKIAEEGAKLHFFRQGPEIACRKFRQINRRHELAIEPGP